MSNSDLRVISSKALLGFGTIVAIGFVMAAFIVSNMIKNVAPSSDVITVKGLAEKPIKADNARWQLNIASSGNTAAEAYDKLRQDQEKVIKFIKAQGFSEQQISLGIERAQEMYKENRDANGNYERVFQGYKADRLILVETKDVNQMDLAAKQAFKLDEMDVAVINLQPEYLVSDLESVKMSLIADATKNAYIRATEFAKSGNAKVGAMKSASQGAFYILAAQGGTDDSDYGGVYDKSTINKTARVVVTINYGIKN